VAVPVRVKVTVPVGAVGLASVSVTVAVHVEAWFTTTGVSQLTEVVEVCGRGGVTVMLNAVVVLLPL